MPECVCFDHGGENIGVWQFMIASHNGGPSTVLIGSQSIRVVLFDGMNDVIQLLVSQDCMVISAI